LESKSKIKPDVIGSISAYDNEFMNNQAPGYHSSLPKPCSEQPLLNFFEELKIYYWDES
jgi:hypothetical protein